MEDVSKIQRFYCDKNVFITGATGFVGKLLLAKLLRCCPGIGKIFLLIRAKKGFDVNTRFQEIFNNPVFDSLEGEVPEFRKKIVLIVGDCSEDNLGISASDLKVILENVNVIFHVAATVRFNEHLRVALKINVKATSDLLKMAKKMQNLNAFMYVSTAYSNAHMPLIEEKNYPLSTDWMSVWEIVKNQTDADIEKMLPTLSGGLPNSYTFTKALAEKEIMLNSQNIPVGILRPAIVISTAEEPIKGWVDNFYGPVGVIVSCGMGLMRTLNCDGNVSADVVPADYVVNCLITASLDVHEAFMTRPMSYKPLIYNYVSSVENNITWREFARGFLSGLHDFPFTRTAWYNFLWLNKYLVIHHTCALFLHYIPALVGDMILILLFKEPRMIKDYRKINQMSSLITFFITKNLKFCNRRTRNLWERSTKIDKKIFPFSMSEINWSQYNKEFVLGIRRHILKENDDQLPQARQKYKRLYFLHCGFKFSLFILILGFWFRLFKFNSVL